MQLFLLIVTVCLINGQLPENDINTNRQSTSDPFNRYSTQRPDGVSTERNFFGQSNLNNNNNNRFGGVPNSIPNRERDRPIYNPFGKTSNTDSVLIQDAKYFVVASRMVRPGQLYRVLVSVLESHIPLRVRASISRDGVEASSDKKDVKIGIPETLLMRVPTTSVPGHYTLRVEGLYNSLHGGSAFVNESSLTFSQRSMSIFVQTDKPVYMQDEVVKFRAIPITTELKGFDNAIDVYMLDPKQNIMRRWLSRQSNLGAVSLTYPLSDQPVFGEWTIRIVARGQVEEAKFIVEEYYQTRFEVNVTMPAFFFNSDPYIHGRVMANFTNGAPVRGNLTIKATVRPIGFLNPKAINEKYRVWHNGPLNQRDFYNNQQYLNNGQYPYQNGVNLNPAFGSSGIVGSDITQDPNLQDPRYNPLGYSDQHVIEKVFEFQEEWPFWVKKPEFTEEYDYNTKTYRSRLPYLRYFNGTYDFKFPMRELTNFGNQNVEILITARVGERFYDDIAEGYSMARVYNSSIRASFLGGTPQVFKPGMPFSVYVVVEFHDGSPLPYDVLYQSSMEIAGSVESRAGGRRDYPIKQLRMSEKPGIWELKIDLRNDLNMDNSRTSKEFLNEIINMRLTANFIDFRGERTTAEALLLSHFSPQNKHIKVYTSTEDAKVGEYIILHIQANFYMDNFHYIVMSKGLVLVTGQENIKSSIHTIALTLSAEMAPVATIVVWHIGRKGVIVADSLTFPVNGISRNNFTVFINNRKARTGEKVEVAIYGEAGAYVGLSGIDNAFYTMQAGHDLTYAKVITKMSTFDEQTNGTHKHTWYSHAGNPDELVYYPSSTFGIDANRTFEYAGLIVFTDVIVPRRFDNCNLTLGYAECLNGRCYRVDKKCDGLYDCDDGTDELNCEDINNNRTLISEFRKYRFNRIKRHYENVWLWRDINIGPHGRFIFSIDVPQRPAHWMVSAFSISPNFGFGMAKRAIEYIGVQPFFINLEMPSACGSGEQVGIRITVFNYMTTAIESTVVLHGSPDYKFVHVGDKGIVTSYNPKTSFGEHHFFIYIEAQGTSTVYIPIVPTRLGDIIVKVHASTLLGKHQITRKLTVFPDGLPQYRHQAILMDLSSRAYVFQYMHVNVTETPIIPYEADRYYVFGSNYAKISMVGDVVGPIFPTMPVNATSLLHLPMDSAEQNMFSFAANLFTIMYMRLINQRNITIENKAFYHLNIGYQKQLSYMKRDGSFSAFRSDWNQSDSSVWLTAYCARIFQEASFYEWENFIYIDPAIIQKSIVWLLRHQTPEGSFYETTWSPDRKMNLTANANLRSKNITLTAHVLITLASMKDLSGVSCFIILLFLSLIDVLFYSSSFF